MVVDYLVLFAFRILRSVQLTLISCLILTCVFIICFFIKTVFCYLYLRLYLPGPKGSLLMGNLHQINYERTNYDIPKKQFWKQMNLHNKGIYRIVVGHHVHVVLQNPATVALILKNSTPKVSAILQMLYPWLGQGIMTNERGKWKRSRKILCPMFSYEALQDYLQEFNTSADTLIRIWTRVPNKQSIQVGSYLNKYTLEVLVNCIFLKKRCIQENTERSVLQYLEKLGEIQGALIERLFNPVYQFDCFYFRTQKGKKFLRDVEEANKFLSSLIVESQRYKHGDILTVSPSDKGRRNIVEMLLNARDEEGHKLTTEEMLAEINNILFAGYEPTAISLQYILYCLAKYPENQEACRREVISIMNGRSEIEWRDLANFRFLTKCIRESLRLYSPMSSLSRQTDTSMVVDGYWLPAGTKIMVNMWQLHEDPAIWPEPLTFNPHRFKDDDCNQKSFTYLPFSAGHRRCLGQHFATTEMKVLLAKILMNYRIQLSDNFNLTRINRYLIVPAKDVQLKLSKV